MVTAVVLRELPPAQEDFHVKMKFGKNQKKVPLKDKTFQSLEEAARNFFEKVKQSTEPVYFIVDECTIQDDRDLQQHTIVKDMMVQVELGSPD